MSATQFLLLVALLASPLAVYGLSCSQQWECSGVSADYNYVQCIDGQCACRNSNGFNGSATVNDKCRCDYTVAWGNGVPFCKLCVAPRHIVYQDGIPYCLQEAECESLIAQQEREAIRISQVKKVYNNLVYPKPFQIISGQVLVDDIFASNVKGRITPLGSFDNFVAVEEYFYGLGASQSSRVDYVTFKSISASGDYVGVEVDIFFNYSLVGRPSRNLTQTGFYKFNSENKIESIDLTILNIGFALDGLTASEAAKNGSIVRLCNTLLVNPRYCPPETDPAGYYTDVADCVTFMRSIPFGSWNQAHSNTVTCRNLHALLTAFRPLEHCPHAGKTGGMKCIDEPYEAFYAKDY